MVAAQCQEARVEPSPDLDLLEYLGAWAGDDDEWFVIEEWEKGNPERGRDAAEDGAEQEDDEDDKSE